MTIAIRYSMTGEDAAISRLDKLDMAGRDLGLAFYTIAQKLQEYERAQFESEGAYGSGGWAPLKPAYKAWKERRYPGKPILQREGDLMASLTEDAAPGAVREVGPDHLVFGTSIEYAKYHQYGTEKMVPRPPVPPIKIGVRGYFTRIIKDTLMAQITWEKSGGFNGPTINQDLSTP